MTIDLKYVCVHCLDNIYGQCYKCNRIGHYANKCPLKGMSYNTYSNCDSSDDEYYSSKPQKKIKCYNCGKFGHYSKNCYAKKSYKK